MRLIYELRAPAYTAGGPLVADDAVPASLKSEVAAENIKYMEAKEEWDKERQIRRLRVFHNDHLLNVVVNENDTLKHLVEVVVAAANAAPPPESADTDDAAAALAVAAAEPLTPDNCRLRMYDSIKGLTLEPLGTGDLSVTLKSLGVVSHKPLTLEVKAAGAEFSEYADGAFPLKLALLDLETKQCVLGCWGVGVLGMMCTLACR